MSSGAGKPACFSQAPAVRARGTGEPGCEAARDSAGPGCVATAGNERPSRQYRSRALVIEDTRTACAVRIAHAEVMTST
eukprot:1170922-Pyramimonas_sp.AAC.1